MCFNTIFVIAPSWISNDLTLFMIKAKHRLLGNFHPVSSEWFYSLLTIVVRSLIFAVCSLIGLGYDSVSVLEMPAKIV